MNPTPRGPQSQQVFRSALLLAWMLAACGTTQSLAPRFQPPPPPLPPPGRVLADTLAVAASAKPAAPPAIAIGITSAPPRLMAWDPQGKLLWQQPIEARSAPLLAGNALVIAEPAGIVVRDLQSGATRVVLDDDAALVAADGDGDRLVIAMQPHTDAGAVAGGLIALVAGGQVRWKQRLTLPVGTPALVAGRVLVPWATQRLSVLDAGDGRELARWTSTRAVLGHVLVREGHIYVGQHSLWPLSAALFEAGARTLPPPANTPALRALPAQPPLLLDGYASAPDPGSVYHHVRLDWELSQAGAVGDALFLRFYRMLFAFDAQVDRLRWVRVLERDIVGANVVQSGILVADAAGSLRLFEHGGAERELLALGQPLQLLALSAPERWIPAPAPNPAPATNPAGDLAPQLIAAATLDDARLLEGRAYAAQRLSALEGEHVTSQLVQLCSSATQPEPVRRAACDGLGQRPDGGPAVIAALRAGFVAGPPLGALTKAALRMRLQKAAPLLLSYISDVRTGPGELPLVINALREFDHKPAAAPIERFLRMHHAEPEGSDLLPALHASTDALAGLRAPTSRALLERVASDGFAQPALRTSAEQALSTLKAKPKPALALQKAAPEPPAPPPALPPVDRRPLELSSERVATALAPVRAKLVKCLASAAGKPASSRISMVVDGQGKVEGVFVTPTALQACIEPLIRAQPLPATRSGRQRVNYVVHARPAK